MKPTPAPKIDFDLSGAMQKGLTEGFIMFLKIGWPYILLAIALIAFRFWFESKEAERRKANQRREIEERVRIEEEVREKIRAEKR